jgi:hypothetical protein
VSCREAAGFGGNWKEKEKGEEEKRERGMVRLFRLLGQDQPVAKGYTQPIACRFML